MGGAHSPPHRGGWRDSLIEAGAPGAKREPDRAKPLLMFGETLRRSDHPDCAASVASRHSFDSAASPPLRGGEYYPTIITVLRREITNSQQPPAEQFDPARFLSAACTSHLQLNCKPSFERCSSRSSSRR